jgi:two-component system phosphate regulon sensor histidine kinase PhoR
VEPVARRRRLTLTIAIPGTFPSVRADASALETVLGNLVENAVKYVPEEGRVEVRVRETEGMARIEVADSGPGIAAEHLPRIFERFYRVDPSRSREMGGTGLGLAIVKHLSQALGGQAGVESEPGRGSVFYILLPLAAPDSDAA